MGQITIDILIFAGIALFLFFKLRSVLGEVDPSEQDNKKPINKSQIKAKEKSTTNRETNKSGRSERLARLNPQNTPGQWPTPLPDFDLVVNATAHNALVHVHSVAPKLDPYHFIEGSKRAFSMIIDAFAKGDKDTLKNLLSEDLFTLYNDVIDTREANGETWDSDIVEITSAKIKAAHIEDDMVTITVDFEGKEKVTARDKDGQFIDGQKGDIEKTQNRWSFTKNIQDGSHIWLLTETEEIGD